MRNLVFACLAKNPADRPASAAHLARAASALRRGDVAAAAAAVPAIIDGTTATAATMLMPGAGNNAATTVMPAAVAGSRTEASAAEAAGKKKKRSPWTWPLIALIALLAIVLTGTLIALVNQNNETPAPAPTSASATPSRSPTPEPSATPTPTPTPTRVSVVPEEFIGLTSAEARAKLQGMELVADIQSGNAATEVEQEDRVYSVNPTGPVQRNSTITVKVYAPIVAPTTPSAAPTVTPAAAAPGTAVTVTWTHQTCPSGQERSGYEVLAEGGGTSSPAPSGPDSTSATVTAGSATFTVKFRYFCGQVGSEYSPAATVTVPAVPAATPTPTATAAS